MSMKDYASNKIWNLEPAIVAKYWKKYSYTFRVNCISFKYSPRLIFTTRFNDIPVQMNLTIP